MLARVSRVTLVFKEPGPRRVPPSPLRGSFPPHLARSRSVKRDGENRRRKADVNAAPHFRTCGRTCRRKLPSERALCRQENGRSGPFAAVEAPFRVSVRRNMSPFEPSRPRWRPHRAFRRRLGAARSALDAPFKSRGFPGVVRALALRSAHRRRGPRGLRNARRPCSAARRKGFRAGPPDAASAQGARPVTAARAPRRPWAGSRTAAPPRRCACGCSLR